MRALSNTLLAAVSLCALASGAQQSGTKSLNPAEKTSGGVNFARDNDNFGGDPAPALQSSLAPEREKGDISSDRRHIVARRVVGSSELDKRGECGPGCWWNKEKQECNCCPNDSTKCQDGGCCPSGTYCVKSKTGEGSCCPNGKQCDGAIPEGKNRDQGPGKCDRST